MGCLGGLSRGVSRRFVQQGCLGVSKGLCSSVSRGCLGGVV